ncbi:MAG: hypothetical protein BGN87_22380 [Rhizobiales bacterium 65-79]|jgi:hypothetical protein|nr:MAG: hypothetical protein BGN87_22380 [Rhizobiales bacterium 65-79]
MLISFAESSFSLSRLTARSTLAVRMMQIATGTCLIKGIRSFAFGTAMYSGGERRFVEQSLLL